MNTNFLIPDYVSLLLGASQKGQNKIVMELATILNKTVFLTNSVLEKIYISTVGQNIEIDYLEEFCPLGSEEYSLKRSFFKMDGCEKIGLCFPIRVNRILKNYLIVVCEDTFVEEAKRYSEIICYAGKLLELEIQKNEDILLEKKKLKDIFIYDLIYGNIKKTEEIINYGQLWNWNFSFSHLVTTFSLKNFDFYSEDAKYIEMIDTAINKIFNEQNENAITLVKRNEVVLIYLSDNNEKISIILEEILNKVKKYLLKYPFNSRICIGIGKKRVNAIEIFRSYQEAKIAYELGEILHLSIAKFDSLGLEKILYNHDSQEVREFFEQILGNLIKEDEVNNLNLVATLEELVRNQFDIGKTSETMYIHKNTLRYRVKKIEEALDVKLSDLDVRLNISAALKIKQLGKLNK